MEADEFDARVARLLATMEEAAALLRAHGQPGWATWLERDLYRIADGDRGGIEHLLSAYGGMGSLNDVVLMPTDGDPFGDERLSVLRSAMFADASALLRHLSG